MAQSIYKLGYGLGWMTEFEYGLVISWYPHCTIYLWDLLSPLFRGNGALSSGVQWPSRESNYLPPSSDEIKNEWNYTFTPAYVFML